MAQGERLLAVDEPVRAWWSVTGGLVDFLPRSRIASPCSSSSSSDSRETWMGCVTGQGQEEEGRGDSDTTCLCFQLPYGCGTRVVRLPQVCLCFALRRLCS